MERTTKRALSFSALIAAAVVFGMVVASSINVTPKSEAQRTTPAATRPLHTGGVALPSFADVAQETMPSLVSITSTDIVKGSQGRHGQMNPFGGDGDPFEFFFGPPGGGRRNGPRGDDEEHKEVQGGTGFIISDDGYIVTNNHVIDGADKIEVRVNNKEKYTAKLIGKDPATDLALLKIETKQRLTPLSLGDSDKLRVGEWVMAIGDPLNFDKTVTVGVVSAKDRSGLTADAATRSFENYIQTDAAINFGNSGGPLINVNGEVIGINTAMFRPAQNIGFAIPVNTLKQVLPQLREKGKVTRGFLGINIVNVDADRAAAFGLKSEDGAFIESVETGKPAEKAGVKPGDTIVKVDSVPVKDTRDLIGYVSGKAPGSKVQLGVVREGKEQTLTATLSEREGEGGDGENPEKVASDDSHDKIGKIGVSVMELTPQVRQMQRIKDGVDGLLVVRVKEVSPAADAAIQEGDIITAVNGQKVSTADQFGKLVASAKKGDYLKLYVFSPRANISRFALVHID
ncbi:MAG TPA: Do family serine endopeptidase [Thermoanaerobaculia bacterium]|jgi:serine protease Do